METIVIPSALIGILVSFVGWLLSRAVRNLDTSITAVGAKIDVLAASDAQASRDIVELRVRVGTLERETATQERRMDDYSGFFASLGFKKRDG